MRLPGFYDGRKAKRGPDPDRLRLRDLSPGGGPMAALFTGRNPYVLMAVIAAMMIVAGLVVQQRWRTKVMQEPVVVEERHEVGLAIHNMSVLRVALEGFRADCGRLPATAEGLAALVRNPGVEGWHGPYIQGLRPDPWGHPYRYASEGEAVELVSDGPDGRPGGDDDIVYGSSDALGGSSTQGEFNVRLVPSE